MKKNKNKRKQKLKKVTRYNKVNGIQFDDKRNIIKDQTEDQLVEEIYEILTNSKFTNETRYQIVSKLCRDWTERNSVGKYRGIQFWSEKAFVKYVEICKDFHTLTEINEECKKHFRHEHILPVKASVEHFSSDKDFTKEDVRTLLLNKVNAAIILKSEDKLLNDKYKDSMPESFLESDNILDRYTEIGIKLKNTRWDNKMHHIIEAIDMDPRLDVFWNEFLQAHIKGYQEIMGTIETILQNFAKDPSQPFAGTTHKIIRQGKWSEF